MEKRVPHCRLSRIKALLEAGQIRTTAAAMAGGAALGLDYDQMIEVVGSLTITDFYKSMTTHGDHRIWQDVYRPFTKAGWIYLKLTVIDDLLIVSFKELQA
ncbi:type II toxin-antitoxin system MqsR family toxin [Pseudomonas sp. 210_17 TE3656]